METTEVTITETRFKNLIENEKFAHYSIELLLNIAIEKAKQEGLEGLEIVNRAREILKKEWKVPFIIFQSKEWIGAYDSERTVINCLSTNEFGTGLLNQAFPLSE